jgi:hypothetical protein
VRGLNGPVEEATAYENRWAGAGDNGPTGPDHKEDSNKKRSLNFNEFLEFGRTWRNFTRRFRRNLDMGIFPKFFRALQGF